MDLKFLDTIGKVADLEKCTSLRGLAVWFGSAHTEQLFTAQVTETLGKRLYIITLHSKAMLLTHRATLNSNPVFSGWTKNEKVLFKY